MSEIIFFLKNLWGRIMSGLKSTDKVVAPTPSEKTPAWYAIAYKEIGIREIRNGDNPRIVEYHMSTKLKATNDETPWCASFVCWCLEQAGIESTRSAWARGYLNWGIPITKPRLGCVVVLSRGVDMGHVGFFISETTDSIMLLSGNSSNSVNISEYNKANLLGYRWPATNS